METLRKSSAAELAGRYSALREVLVQHKMVEINGTHVPIEAPVGLDMIYLGRSADASYVLEDFNVGRD